MNWFWMNVPLMVVFFAAITGIPLWLTFHHPDTAPATLTAASQAVDTAVAATLLPQPELVGAH